MEAIKSLIKGVLQKLETRQKESGHENPEVLLKKFLTKRDLAHIKFNYFKRGVLSIKVDSSVRLYSLSLQKERLLTKLNKGLPAVKDIRFVLGEVRQASA